MAAQDIFPITLRRRASGKALLPWLLPAAIYYGFLLTAGSSGLFAPVQHGLTFNSMLLHLLHGRFDVDPAAIGDEGFLRDGAVYAYFGIFSALVRAPFLWLPNFATTDFTRLACLAAVSLMALLKLMSARLAWRHAGEQAPTVLLTLLTVAILISGPQIEFLRPSIFQEIELWAGTLSAGFVYLTLRGLFREAGFTPRLLCGMAAVAGLCLLTRVSNALGLYLSLGFVWLCLAWRTFKERREPAALATPLIILAGFAAVTALVNLSRWGNPLVFVDFTRSLLLEQYPDRLGRLQRFADFDLTRLVYGLGYYFAPFWVLRDGAGDFVWSGFQDGYSACCSELPPSSLLISDPLLVGLGVCGAAAAWRTGAARRGLIVAAALGLCVPCLLMLTAAGMTFRYRMEFYPLFELFAFLGFARLAARSTRRATIAVAAGTVAGILTAHAAWALYMLSPFGPAGKVMGSLGIVDFYRSLFE